MSEFKDIIELMRQQMEAMERQRREEKELMERQRQEEKEAMELQHQQQMDALIKLVLYSATWYVCC